MTNRAFIKRSVKNMVILLVLPLFGLYWLMSGGGKSDGTFQAYSQFLSLFPGRTGTYIRAAFYRLACPDTSDEIYVGFLTVFSHRDTTIHRGVYIGPQCNIGMCTIGENTLLGSGVHVLSGNRQHRFSDPDTPIQEQRGLLVKIPIGKDCWIGNGAIIVAPLANRAIVASGSVYTRPCSEGDIVGGNPASLIRTRNDQG